MCETITTPVQHRNAKQGDKAHAGRKIQIDAAQPQGRNTPPPAKTAQSSK